eukprot:scaffold732_cov192-Ochromonas_danica.AAC.1
MMTSRPEDSILALASVLNRIDRVSGRSAETALTATGAVPNNKQKQTTAGLPSTTTTTTTTEVAAEVTTKQSDEAEEPYEKKKEEEEEESVVAVESALSSSLWYEFVEPASGKSYYHNYSTQTTSWEKPASFVPHNAYLGPSANTTASSTAVLPETDPTAFRAFFNRNDGRFTGQDYWDSKGIPRDRSARQLSRYMDLNELEANREEARRRRQEVTQSRSAAEWAAHNAAKKQEKKRKREAWLVED